MPPTLNSQIASGYVAGNTFNIPRVVPAIPTGLTISKAWLTIKVNETDADPGVVQKAITSTLVAGQGQITAIGDGTGGEPVGTGALFFIITSADSTLLGAGKKYVFDVKLKFSDGSFATTERGVAGPLLVSITQATA